ncbi:HNH endonuclease [Candidatus Magnetoovum chiemensis]|nr:HNH endonuclease [Candidatus Magnetoovum chiemensis]
MLHLSESFLNEQKKRAYNIRKTAWWKRKLQKGVCYYCLNCFPSNELTMDHVIPISKGGMSVKNNLVVSCKQCNNKKKHLLPCQWNEYMDRLKGIE